MRETFHQKVAARKRGSSSRIESLVPRDYIYQLPEESPSISHSSQALEAPPPISMELLPSIYALSLDSELKRIQPRAHNCLLPSHLLFFFLFVLVSPFKERIHQRPGLSFMRTNHPPLLLSHGTPFGVPAVHRVILSERRSAASRRSGSKSLARRVE
jgi:hypothetical protein